MRPKGGWVLAFLWDKAGRLPGSALQAFGMARVSELSSESIRMHRVDLYCFTRPRMRKFCQRILKPFTAFVCGTTFKSIIPITLMCENSPCLNLESMMHTVQPGRLSRKWSNDTDRNCFCNAACGLTSRIRGCRKGGEGQSRQWSHAEGLGGSPSKQLFLSPSVEPPPPLLFLWDVLDMLVMSVGPCVFFHRAEWLGGPGPISRIILLCGPEPLSHCPGLPSCLSSGPSL